MGLPILFECLLCEYVRDYRAVLIQIFPDSQCDGSERLSKLSSGADVYFPVVKKSPLTVSKKIYEFYTAPITKFWMHTVCVLFTGKCRPRYVVDLLVFGHWSIRGRYPRHSGIIHKILENYVRLCDSLLQIMRKFSNTIYHVI